MSCFTCSLVLAYLATMGNNFDANGVGDKVCQQANILHADCNSITCSRTCCREDSSNENDRVCDFDIDFFKLSGLDCGEWWMVCGAVVYDPEPVT